MRLQAHATHQMPLPLFAVQAAPRQSQPSTRPDARKRQDGASGAKQGHPMPEGRPRYRMESSMDTKVWDVVPKRIPVVRADYEVRGWLNERRQRK